MKDERKLIAKPMWVVYHWHYSSGFDEEGMNDFLYCSFDKETAIQILCNLHKDNPEWKWNEEHTAFFDTQKEEDASEEYYISEEWCCVETKPEKVIFPWERKEVDEAWDTWAKNLPNKAFSKEEPADV